MMDNQRNKRVILFFIGILILAIGIALFIQSNTGSDPFTTFNLGLSSKLNQMFAPVQVGVNFIILLGILVVDKKYIRIGTLLSMLMVGPLIQVNLFLFKQLISVINISIPSYILLALGCILVCMGAGIYIASDMGAGPYDIIPILVEDKWGYSFQLTRIGLDVGCVILGALLGATIGIGTLAAAILLGPGIEYFRKMTQVYVLKNTY